MKAFLTSRGSIPSLIMRGRAYSNRVPLTILLAMYALWVIAVSPATAQMVSTWSGGAGAWSDCPPPPGTALWDTCGENPPVFPNGNFDAVINGGPVTMTSASVVNLTIGPGDSLIFASGTSGILTVTGTSITNNGSIQIASGDGLQLLGPTTITLSGTGNVSIAGSNFTASGTPTLILQQPVHGYGSFSLGMNLTNQSTINATGGTLAMQPSSVTNTGTMQASSGATLAFNTGFTATYNNSGGVIKALAGGIVQMNGNIVNGGTVTTVGTGVIQANGQAVLNGLTNSGAVQAIAAALEGTITNTGTIQVPSGTLNMSGSVTLSGSGSIVMSGTSTLKQATGTDTLTNQQLIHGTGTIYQLPLTNQGTIAADSKGNFLYFEGGAITNTATLEAENGGTLQLDTVVNNSGGKIEALNGSTVIFTDNFHGSINGGTLTTSGSGVIESQNGLLDGTVNVPTNAGKLNVNNFNLYVQGTINNVGTIALTGNTCIVLDQPTTLTGAGKLTMASTTCISGSGNAFSNQSTIQGAGSIGDSSQMPISNSGTILANQSSPLLIVPNATGFTNTGKLIVNAGSTLNINGLFTNLSSGGTLTGGTYTVTGTLGLQNSVITNAATITLSGASAQILNGASNGLSGLTANSSHGVLTLQGGQALSTTTSLSNAGKVIVGTGSSLSTGGSFTQTAGSATVDGTLKTPSFALQKGSLLGQGTVNGSLISSAAVIAGDSTSKAGKLAVTGSYTQNASGVLDVAVGGTTVGTQYSQLAVSNGASLNGILNIKLINAFTPAIGDTFTILTGSSVAGTFATVNGLSINSGEHFEISYGATAVTLTVASGP